MVKHNMSGIVQLMRKAVDRLQQEGAIRPASGRIVRLQDVFPFRPEDVDDIGYEGTDIRFHLRNGRIYDDKGKLVETGAPKA
jgi:hypothetical protein